jgi:putative membrane protein
VPLGDEVFAMKAYCEGMAEVVKSKLACEKATQPAVKAFAQQMVKDHHRVAPQLTVETTTTW